MTGPPFGEVCGNKHQVVGIGLSLARQRCGGRDEV